MVTLNFIYVICHNVPAEVYREVETLTPTPQVIMKTLKLLILGCLFFALSGNLCAQHFELPPLPPTRHITNQQLLGKWLYEAHEQTFYGKMMLEFKVDGTISSVNEIELSGEKTVSHGTGTYKLKEGVLTTYITEKGKKNIDVFAVKLNSNHELTFRNKELSFEMKHVK